MPVRRPSCPSVKNGGIVGWAVFYAGPRAKLHFQGVSSIVEGDEKGATRV
jgi:hypothetical protein